MGQRTSDNLADVAEAIEEVNEEKDEPAVLVKAEGGPSGIITKADLL